MACLQGEPQCYSLARHKDMEIKFVAYIEPSEHIRETHLKSLLEVVFEQSLKELAKLREQLANDPEKLVKKERDFIIYECSKLESLGMLQAKLDEYRASMSNLNASQRAENAFESSNNSDKLGNHLRANGLFKPNHKWQAHHIICSQHASHAAARFKLFAHMGINDPHNGCWLPQKHKHATSTVYPNAVGHNYLHTNKYADWVRREVRSASDKEDLIRRLRSIRMKLLDAKSLPDILTEKGKTDLRTSV